jgi:hypothetical protein
MPILCSTSRLSISLDVSSRVRGWWWGRVFFERELELLAQDSREIRLVGEELFFLTVDRLLVLLVDQLQELGSSVRRDFLSRVRGGVERGSDRSVC